RSPGDILDRVNELTFNASLLTQMRAIEFVNQLLAEGALAGDRCRRILLHRIDGGPAMAPYPASSKSSTDREMIGQLFAIGHSTARQWLERHFDALGRHGTVDVRRDYLDDTQLRLAPRQANGQPRGFRPWLARQLQRLKRR
ncbi:MAG TPA: patatin-like phospholipase family protein, partial [Ramlibacter sp.]|nr:patatin-like phospholipase family protein [Ramlibacter sp.]